MWRHFSVLSAVLGILAVALPLYALGAIFYVAMAAALAQAVWHFTLIRTRTREGCFKAFRINHWLGATVFAGIAGSYPLRSLLTNLIAASACWISARAKMPQAPNSLPIPSARWSAQHALNAERGTHAISLHRLQRGIGGAALDVTRWRSTADSSERRASSDAYKCAHGQLVRLLFAQPPCRRPRGSWLRGSRKRTLGQSQKGPSRRRAARFPPTGTRR